MPSVLLRPFRLRRLGVCQDSEKDVA